MLPTFLPGETVTAALTLPAVDLVLVASDGRVRIGVCGVTGKV